MLHVYSLWQNNCLSYFAFFVVGEDIEIVSLTGRLISVTIVGLFVKVPCS